MAVSHINGVAISSISHINGIAKGALSDILGVSIPSGVGGGIAWQESVASTSGFGRTPTVSYPTASADDIWVAIAITNDHNLTFNGTPPSGWTLVLEQAGASEAIAIFWKRSSASESSSEAWTNILSSNQSGGIWIVAAYSGCVASGSPIDVSASNAATGTAYDIGATSTVNNCMAIAVVGNEKSGATTFTWDGGITERIDADTTPSGTGNNNTNLYIAEELVATAGAYSLGGDLAATAFSGAEATIALTPA